MSFSKRLYWAILALLPTGWAIRIHYYRVYRRLPDLRAPKTFSEKTNWRKLHQRDPRFTLYSDKVAVKDEIARLIGPEHVIPTLWTGDRPEDIPFASLVPPYVVKVSHGYGSNILVRGPADVDEARIRASVARRLSERHGRATGQWGYEGIRPRVLIERMLDIFGKDEAEDYKFFVYHGRARFIQVNFDRWGRDLIAYFDRDWNRLRMEPSRFDLPRELPRPPLLMEMIALAEKVGAAFDFVRVDLYHEAGRVYFGETTFYHSAGYSVSLGGKLDELFGEPWRVEPYPPKAERTR